MKVKKLLALVLSAIMAVSMLTACGGGGGSSAKREEIDLDRIGRQVRASVDGAQIEELPELEKGMDAAAQVIAKKNKADIQSSDVTAVIKEYINELRRSIDIFVTAPNFSGDMNKKLADLVIENAAKSETNIFYVSARAVETNDDQMYYFFVVILK